MRKIESFLFSLVALISVLVNTFFNWIDIVNTWVVHGGGHLELLMVVL